MIFSSKRYRIFHVKTLEILEKHCRHIVSVKYFRGHFLQFPSAIIKIFISGGQLGTSL